MDRNDIKARLHAVGNTLISELISLTPETMPEIQFEIVATDDGGADIGLLENHPDAKKVTLSEVVYQCAVQYLPLVKNYVPEWKRTLFVLRESQGQWKVSVEFERG